MATKLGDARIRIELDPQEAEDALKRIEDRIRAADEAMSEQEQEENKGKKQSGDSHGRRGGGDNPSSGRGGEDPGMNNANPGRFGVQNIRGLLSAEGIAGALPVIGGTAKFVVGAELKYGALARGLTEGLADEGLKEVEAIPGIGKPLAKALRGMIAVQNKTGEVAHAALATGNSYLKSVEPTADAVIAMAQGQLITGGHLDLKFTGTYLANIFDINRVMIRNEQAKKDATNKALGEAGGVDLMKAIVKLAKR